MIMVTYVAGQVLLLGEDGLITLQLSRESSEVSRHSCFVCNTALHPIAEIGMLNIVCGDLRAYGLKTFSAAMPLAYGSKSLVSMLAACSNRAVALRSEGSGRRGVPWSRYFAAM